jgi:hypothetical protein
MKGENMKSKQIEIDGKVYEVVELSMEAGIPLISRENGALDTAGLIRAATRIDGVPAKEGDLSFGVAMKLMPLVMELNMFSGGEAGNA